MKVYVTHVYDAKDHLHDYYVHQTSVSALIQAARDVVVGHFVNLDPKREQDEVLRALGASSVEPRVRRWHVRCEMWFAQIDPMEVHGEKCLPKLEVM